MPENSAIRSKDTSLRYMAGYPNWYRWKILARSSHQMEKRSIFIANSVVDADFDSLAIGNDVRYVEEAGDEGPQASTVYIIGKHHIVD